MKFRTENIREITNIELIVKNPSGSERIIYNQQYLEYLLQGYESTFIDFPETGVSIKITLNYETAPAKRKRKDKITIAKISVVGLNYSGKTSILQRLHLGKFIEETRPTIGMNAETFLIDNLRINAWDIGGQLQFINSLWFQYTKKSMGLVYVIDLHDKQRLSSARAYLQKVLEFDHIRGIPIAVMCNKIDLIDDIDEITINDLSNILGLRHLDKNLKPFLTSAKTGIGISEAFYWLADQIQIN